MQIYNSLTGKKEEFEPLNPPNVSFYMCGPTVYDFFHIGNGRSFIMADVLRKYLTYKGYNVKFIMNLTDIDDKIIKRANEKRIDASEVAKTNTNNFLNDIKKLGIKKADIYPKATEHIEDIIVLIKSLEDKGFAYNVDGDVFYEVSKFKEYGKLSKKKIDELESGSRIEINKSKKNPLDFSLWKKAKDGEPYWESPWGKGRPGWHVECSVMSMCHLGESIDIHAGGTDLIFPHHENEIAQSEAATNKPFVKYWVHFGFLNIQDEKMSKSTGNFFTARDIAKKYKPEEIRLAFLQTHYSGPLNFSEELLHSAKTGLEKFQNFEFSLSEKLKTSVDSGVIPNVNIEKYKSDFESCMDDDFNTPKALAVLFDFIKNVNKEISLIASIDKIFLENVLAFLSSTAGDVLGIINDETSEQSADLDKKLIQLLIDIRVDAKQSKNYNLADKIRDELTNMGVVLQDSKEGTVFRISK